MASPIPWAPPVMTATLSFNFMVVSLAGGVAAVDDQNLAGHVACGIGAEKDRSRRDLVGLADAGHGGHALPDREHLRILDTAAGEVRLDIAGSHRVDTNI